MKQNCFLNAWCVGYWQRAQFITTASKFDTGDVMLDGG